MFLLQRSFASNKRKLTNLVFKIIINKNLVTIDVYMKIFWVIIHNIRNINKNDDNKDKKFCSQWTFEHILYKTKTYISLNGQEMMKNLIYKKA